MHRVVLLLLAVLLPLQFAWGAVTSYCGHESGAAAQHFGHHEHAHEDATPVDTEAALPADNDCWTCHSTALPAITCGGSALPQVAAAHVLCAQAGLQRPSVAPEAPERPQWPRLA